jgi:protein-disulfide isomerase
VHRIVADVAARFPGRVCVAFRHFPLRLHPHAVAAAVAAEAAAAQGAFWAMHDRLFAHPLALTDADLVAHAEALGLDGRAVRAALADDALATRVLAAKRGGVRAGIRSTLALVIDGELFEEDDLEPALVDRVIRPLQAAEG